MRGAPARAIQEPGGQSELGMTQCYMHLSPAALEAAISLLGGAHIGHKPQRQSATLDVRRGWLAVRQGFEPYDRAFLTW
jgi:hypothetical protein